MHLNIEYPCCVTIVSHSIVHLLGLLMDNEDKTIVAWVLGMQDCGFSITL